MLVVSIITAVLLMALVSGRVMPVKGFVFAFVSLLLLYPNSESLISQAANPVLVTLAALYVVVAALGNTGATRLLARYFMHSPKKCYVPKRVLIFTSILSAVVNNSPVVAMLTHVVQGHARRFSISPSQWLLPISYASILGGTCTLIGTSTNLLVDGMVQSAVNYKFDLFEIAWVGVPIAISGWLYLHFFSHLILPNRDGSTETFDHTREYMVEMLILPQSELVGKNIIEAGLRNLPGMFLVEVHKREQILTAVSPKTVLEGGDRLIFAGSPDSVLGLQNIHGLVIADDYRFKLEGNRSERRLFEAVISPSNPIVGSTLKQARFRHRYSAVVLSVCRHGQRLAGRLGDITLRAGDTLLIESQKGFLFRYRNSSDFLLVSKLTDSPQVDATKSVISLLVFSLMLVLSAFGVLSIFKASIVASVLMIVSGCISFEEASKAIDYKVLAVIFCALGLGAAFSDSGLAAQVTTLLLLVGDQPMHLLIMVYLLTLILTEIISNNAAAIIMLPVALSAAASAVVSPLPFAVAVMIAASTSFLTPTGYQTNLMVMGPGGYQFTDYFKLGFPLSVLTASISLMLIPVVWPF
ncbi:SLC13 family permease [Pelagibaculum spongiae]|uniref:SLC13 family permease n=1 Tax=Pelagibaculum spongiae TaxID=2080658 RepID=A0A2V1GV75_9GAMM|nr:SLC13 family permease [Pelagibaculum spongiae]PVZ70238.1 SLC13 family permease [Pelagibaculum spongiae]